VSVQIKEHALFKFLFDRAWEIIDENRRVYILINIVYYGLIVLAMIYVAFNQPLQTEMLKTANEKLLTGALAMIGKEYGPNEFLWAIGAMYFANLMGASYGAITFPSFIIPFAGMALGAFRAVEWGLVFSPANPDIRPAMIMHSLTLVLEGQAYILAMLGAYVHGRMLIWPQTAGLTSRRQAYIEGVRQTGTLYMLIMVVLAIAAIYAVIEVVVLSQLLP
jgi:hypothetical protein